MIHLATGELFFHPIPLEVQLHRCSYGCAYCFATLNYRHAKRTACNTSGLFNFLSEFQQRKTLAAYLLREGYPVTISNHTDPFCQTNRDTTRALLEVLQALQIPVSLQTKGGVSADMLDLIAPSVWYVTITSDDERVREGVEPHAPTFASRLELIDTLRSRGHEVMVGVNPFVPDWWRNLPASMQELKRRGVYGVWMEVMHLNYRQRDQMTDREKDALGVAVMTEAMKRKHSPDLTKAFFQARETILSSGLEFGGGDLVDYRDSAYFAPYRKFYKKTYPNLQDFVNALYQQGRHPDNFLTEREYVDFFAERLPKGKWNEVSQVLGSTNHDLWWDAKVPNKLSYRELLSLIWRNPKTTFHPSKTGSFAIPFDESGKTSRYYAESNGVPLVVFCPEGNGQQYLPVDREKIDFWNMVKHPEWQDADFQQAMTAGIV